MSPTSMNNKLNKTEIAHKYVALLQKGLVSNLLELFATEAVVVSPLQGTLPASEFYERLSRYTATSEITTKGVFTEENGESVALYFTYTWTMANLQTVTFDAVDIMEFNVAHEIVKLTIIYDTIHSRNLWQQIYLN